jgi:2,4-dienoyl-CoA reductase-like NADH-dependent reductase (Old Yellow Enzyme family)
MAKKAKPAKTKSPLFTTGKIGPLKIRNRSIRSAAFEGMCPDGKPSDSLREYHWSVAAGGIGMTTVAYVSVTPDGRSFRHQAWMSPEIIPSLQKLTDAVHREGAAASIQLGHCGNMSDRKVTGIRAMAHSSVLNLFGLNLPKSMSEADIAHVIRSFGAAVTLAIKA